MRITTNYPTSGVLETRPRDECVAINPVPSNEFISRFKKEARSISENKNPDIYFKRECTESTGYASHGHFVDKNGIFSVAKFLHYLSFRVELIWRADATFLQL